ncbi:MAG: TolC family protein [Prevotella sp.]|nr:TolC family protein [Prevotella sp.]
MKRLFSLILLMGGMATVADAQRLLTLDSCRQMALENNKQLGVARVKQDVARNIRKSARTKYLPKVNAVGGYLYTSKQMSILSDDQKQTLGNMGTVADQMMTQMGQPLGAQLAAVLNGVGGGIVDAFHTDTRSLWAASVMLTQPVFMGGSIIALNKMADLGETMAANSADASKQNVLYSIDNAYWTVVSLKHKQQLAKSYLELVKKLDSDVGKMIREGVATRADGLRVGVKVNEAEMTLTQVEDGLALAKMMLCQLCGMDINEDIRLEDEDRDDLATVADGMTADKEMQAMTAAEKRPELKMLRNAVDISNEAVKVAKAGHMPKVMLTGGYTTTNPNVFNSFQRKFGGFWNVGVMVTVPVWNWNDVTYKVRAAKNQTVIANLELDDVREKVELQVSQSNFKVNEATRKLQLAQSSTQRAEENLRCANVGFREGVMQSTDVMEAQTAWLQAQSQKIDAEIEVKLSQVNLSKALGTLHE